MLIIQRVFKLQVRQVKAVGRVLEQTRLVVESHGIDAIMCINLKISEIPINLDLFYLTDVALEVNSL